MIEKYKNLVARGMINKQGYFVPAVHYPAITDYPQITEKDFYSGYTSLNGNHFDIYIHIPFCKGHCTFCHYPSMTGEVTEEIDKYLEYLFKEIDIFKAHRGLESLKARSILIGGGTPTYMSVAQLRCFLEGLSSRVDIKENTQFNYDLDPATMLGQDGRARLELLREYGVDRLTIGINSFNDKILKEMNRPHCAAEALQAVEIAKKLGFIVNIEFIFGLPSQTIQCWEETIRQAISLETHEIQLYRLKIRPYGDRKGDIASISEEQFPSIETIIEMKQLAHGLINKAGLKQTLNRVFSRDTRIYSKYAHNQCCDLLDQVGFGLTAFSSLCDRFAINTLSFDEYYQMIDNGDLPINRGLVRDDVLQREWALILPLKNRSLIKNKYRRITGALPETFFPQKLAFLKGNGLLEEDGAKLQLTEAGMFFADECVQLFYQDRYQPHPLVDYAPGIVTGS